MSKLGMIFVYEGELLHSASYYDQSDFLIQLLDSGTNGGVDSRNEKGLTPLHTASERGSTQCVQVLLERGADPNAVSGLEDGLQTPLHYAAHHDHLGCLMVMLDYEVDLSLTDKFGQTAKDIALEENHLHCSNFLIESEARKHQEYEEAKRNDLYDFVINRQVKEAEGVLLSMEDPDVAINRYYRGANTLLYKASHGGDIEMVKMLLDHGADGRTNADNGISPLYAASHVGHVDIVELLVKSLPSLLGVRMAIDNSGPLHGAAMKDLKIIDVNSQDDSGITPLHYAVRSGSIKTVQALLECKPIVKEIDSSLSPGQLAIDMPMVDGKTALHDAVLMDKTEIAESLLQNGANVNLLFPLDNTTMLQMACERSSVGMVEVLLSFGAKDIDDKVRLKAEKLGRPTIVQLLLNSGIFADTDSDVCLSSESDSSLHPVSVAWHSKHLSSVDTTWMQQGVAAHFKSVSAGAAIKDDQWLCLSLITRIDLSKNEIPEIPGNLFMLVSLKCLNLSENCLTSIPDQFSDNKSNKTDKFDVQCNSLEEFDVSSNKLKSLPKWLFRLPSLATLNASKNKIDTLPIDMWFGPSLKILLLRKNNLTELPKPGTANFSSVIRTSIQSQSSQNRSSTPFKDHLDGNRSLSNSSIKISSCRSSWNSDGFDSDDSDDSDDGGSGVHGPRKNGLDRLDVSSNNLTGIPLGLPCLAPNLSRLMLTSNKIADVSSVSVLPAGLTMLCLSRNTLTRFDLSGRYFVTDRKCYSVIGGERSRTMSFPQYSSTKSSEKLCRHRSHKSLMHLRQLTLNFNCLSELSMVTYQGARQAGNLECLFRGLQTLDISNNAFREVPLNIGQLSKLGSLSLSCNVQIDRLPFELGLCSDLYELRVEKLRLPLKSILHRDIGQEKINAKEVTSHLKSLYENSQPYRRVKLMFVGVSNIGKTSLLCALRKEGSGPYQSPLHQNDFVHRQQAASTGANNSSKGRLSTVGVDVCNWTYQKKSFMNAPLGPEVTFGTWDFGGQQEYYATHQCFLSHHALYILLWKITDKRKGINEMESWLLNIQARAPDSPVIIVGTHFDELPGNDKRQRDAADAFRQIIMTRYVSKELGGGISLPALKGLPKVLHVTEVSCGDSEFQVKELRNVIYDTALALGDDSCGSTMESCVPAIYVQVENAVKRIKQDGIREGDMPVMNESTFKCLLNAELQSNGVRLRNAEEFDASIRFLHDNGLLLHYDDPSLRDLYFIDPQWLCDMLAHIISVRDVNPRISGGLMKVSDLSEQIFRSRRFPSSFVNKYIDLMSKFEVAIKVTHRYLLVPSLLPEKQKNCPELSKHLFPILRNAMDLSAYMDHRVFRRQYLMSYVPSGFWARLITRLIADDRICDIVSDCCTITTHKDIKAMNDISDYKSLTKVVPPEWACWRTGIELSYFGVKLLRVCQLENHTTFYGSTKHGRYPLYIDDTVQDKSDVVTIEIIVPSVTLIIERFASQTKTNDNKGGAEGKDVAPKIAHRVLKTDVKQRDTACRFLALVVEHFDNLLSDWYYVLDMHVSMHGPRGVQRLSLCPRCVKDTSVSENVKNSIPPESGSKNSKRKSQLPNPMPDVIVDATNSNADSYNDSCTSNLLLESAVSDCIAAFSFEEGVKQIDLSQPILCMKHGIQDYTHLFPDIMFEDFANDLVIAPHLLQRGKFLAVGGYGAVFKGALRKDDNHVVDVAIKIPMNTNVDGTENPEAIQNAINNRRLREGDLTTATTNAYRSIRQELSILVPVKHNHIVGMVGVAMAPLSLVIEFAPSGSLNHIMVEINRVGKKMDPFVLQKCTTQVSSALQYLHKRNIIYRDLKSENILVWAFPEPKAPRPDLYPVLLKLTDYGISRSVAISGTRGMLGTHGFIAPEIVQYKGRESYTMKVDSFSFGMLMYELISLSQPFSALLSGKSNLADQLILEGKRPHLSAREKSFPIPVLSLMYQCWEQKPDDRPSSSDIFNTVQLLEFPRFIDALKLGERFSVQCLTSSCTTKQGNAGTMGTSVIGPSLWICGHKDPEDPILQSSNGVISIVSYQERKCGFQKEIQLLDRVLIACGVGSTIWIGTLQGSIQVFCCSSFKPLALGRLLNHRSLLTMIHSPLCHFVFVTLADGSLFCYHDNISMYKHSIPEKDMAAYFSNHCTVAEVIKELIPCKIFPGDMMNNRIHSLAAVTSKASNRVQEQHVTFFGPDGNPIAKTTRETEYSHERNQPEEGDAEPHFELWRGQEKGYISILDVDSMQKMCTIPVRNNTDLNDPTLKGLLVRFMETRQHFATEENFMSSDKTVTRENSIWIVVYPGTEVCRWNVDLRRIVATYDACTHGPQNELASWKSSRKLKTIDASKAQISALLIVEDYMYVGTTLGCLAICNSETLSLYRVIRCFEHPLDSLVPLEALASRYEKNQAKQKLIVCSGRGLLMKSLYKGNSKESLSDRQCLLTLLADHWS